jgi:hypothetical protein
MSAADTEGWRPAVGFPDYEVSDQGRVRSWKPYNGQAAPRVLKGFPSPSGGHLQYRLVDISGESVTTKGHQLVLAAFVGPCPSWADQIRHLDGNPTNNRLSNLRYGTRSENQFDAVRHGTHTQARKTHCPQGHAYAPENVYAEPRTGGRQCRTCRSERGLQRQATRVRCDDCGAEFSASYGARHRRKCPARITVDGSAA